ncbi:MAG: DUF167 domain-containing protein, partial [Anaerolineae bacterium]|nr:DUF167 domain-containing protein [Anaerolineae bacterium]
PEKGQDNVAMTKLIAKVLGVPDGDVAIVAGETGRDKLISILSLDAASVTKRLRAHIG